MIAPSKHQVIVNPASGRRERVFVNLEAIYPTPEEPGTELSFEEIWAAGRGWLDCSWEGDEDEYSGGRQEPFDENAAVDLLSHKVTTKLIVHQDPTGFDENGAVKHPPKSSKTKKKKVMEVNETQISMSATSIVLLPISLTDTFTVKAKLDSPSGPKIRKSKHAAEPTMTIHTRAATDEIYDLFNAPLQQPHQQDESDDEESMSDGDYTSGGESTCTTRQIAMSEAGDDEEDGKSLSEWSDFTPGKHIPNMDGEDADTRVTNLTDEDHFGRISDIDSRQENHRLSTPTEDGPQTRTKFVPIPPEDYVPNSRPFRDPVEVANNRLPFMTPITERTEMSLGMATGAKKLYTTTPISSQHIMEDDEDEDDEEFGPISSPLREILGDKLSPVKIAQPNLKSSTSSKVITKGPVIKDLQCNPVDNAVRDEILAKMHPPLSSYAGFYDHRDSRCNRGAEIRRFAKSNPRSSKPGSSDRSSIGSSPVVLEFPDVNSTYTLKRELGAGAFAPVYLVENSCPDEGADKENSGGHPSEMGKGAFAANHRRASQEALKMEAPPTAWEFHMMRLAATRLGPQHRATTSISAAQELHLYQDEGFLFLQYHAHGTLLDVVNFFREQPSQVMDEPLAMFFTVELLRTVEALHNHGILHGDLKADNCLLRLDTLAGGDSALSPQWSADGSGGWGSRGVTLIDFGRGIDMRAFEPDVQFIADWKTSAADCAEMREGRPWTWQIDYHGLAGTVHVLLFGRYMETVRCDGGGLAASAAGGRRYRIRESLKRYWQTDLWGGLFDLLLNPGSRVADGEAAAEARALPVTADLRRMRETMEAWLEANCEKGLGLRQLMARVEGFAAARARR